MAGAIWIVALLLSRVIGLVRETVLGATLGVSSAADVYAAAFRIPDMVNHVVSGGALSILFIPMFVAHVERGDEARGWRAFSVIANFIVLLFLTLGTAAWIAMPWLAPALTPGFSPEDDAELVRLSRIVLPAQAFHVLGALVSASLLAKDKHAIPALAPLLYTGCTIAGGLIGGDAEGFAWGVLAGAALGVFGLPLVAALRQGLHWRPVVSFTDPDFRAYIVQSLPIMLAFSIVSFDDTAWTHFASRIGEGQVAVLNYAKTLMRVPIGVFGMAMGLAAYPTLVRLVVEGKPGEAYRLLAATTRKVLVLAFGSQVVLTVAGAELGTLVLGTRRIPAERMADLGVCLGLFSLGLGAWTAQTLLARGYYARGKAWAPTWMGFGVLLLALPVYAALADRFGAHGLAAASSVAIVAYVVVLEWRLRADVGEGDGYGGFLLRAIPATALGIAAGLAVRHAMGPPDWTRLDALLRASVLAGVGGFVFLGACFALRLPEAREVVGMVSRKLRRRG